ncbi:beta-nerve growth factor-like [Carcharodon carcharias]|uniref:beta-nerve growth factor-like n=1 Tax=Carcharodon carcharias TaxID=13397 RepID=UPI001B7ECDB6|nr:beta-nerve growth factor-like [Carcharodon carcharias]
MSIFCCFLIIYLSAIPASTRIDNAMLMLPSNPGGHSHGFPPGSAPNTQPLAGRMNVRMRDFHPFTVEADLFRNRPVHSTRVRFHSQHLGELSASDTRAWQPPIKPSHRLKRRDASVRHQGQFSVCDKKHHWILDKKVALDIRGREVSVLSHFYLNGTLVRQMFYETTCKKRKPTRQGCRGIDSRHWNSHCDTTDSHVHALVLDNNLIRWNFIRIRTACVCVLTRKTWKP